MADFKKVGLLAQIGDGAESQRDSATTATKPRVARNELPWENASEKDSPEKGCSPRQW